MMPFGYAALVPLSEPDMPRWMRLSIWQLVVEARVAKDVIGMEVWGVHPAEACDPNRRFRDDPRAPLVVSHAWLFDLGTHRYQTLGLRHPDTLYGDMERVFLQIDETLIRDDTVLLRLRASSGSQPFVQYSRSGERESSHVPFSGRIVTIQPGTVFDAALALAERELP